MKLSVINVTANNLAEIVVDDSMYVITKGGFLSKGEYRMRPVKEVTVEDLISEETIIVRLSE